MNGGCVKGDDFCDGIFLKLNSHGQLVTVDAGRLYMEEEKVFLKGMVRQKFRELFVPIRRTGRERPVLTSARSHPSARTNAMHICRELPTTFL